MPPAASARTQPPPSPFKVTCAPYGWFVALPILFSFVGLVMVAVGGFSCQMIKVVERGSSGYLAFGFTSMAFNSGGKCIQYSDTTYQPDSPLQAGNAFSILATIFGVLTVIAAALTTFIRFPPLALVAMSVTAFSVALASAIATGVGFATESCKAPGYSCTPGPMMYVVMVGTLFWLAAGTTFLFVKKHERDGIMDKAESSAIDEMGPTHNEATGQGDDEAPSTVVETVTNPDGTKTRTTTVTSYKDGQKFVEKTCETV